MPTDLITLTLLAFLGLAIGFVGGLVGLVLGVVRFPIILSTAETSIAVTAGTNIGISTFGSIAGAVRHLRQHNIHLRIFLIMAMSGAAGAFIGSMLTRFFPVQILLVVIGSIVSYEAFSLIRGVQKSAGLSEIESSSRQPNLTLESAIGFGVGLLGGIVGLVLGSIRMPAMIAVLKMEPRVAVGTNLAASAVMGAAGLTGHLLNNEVDFLVLGVMGLTAALGAYIGARYTNKFSASSLKLIIGFVLIIVSIVMFLRAIGIPTALP
jgi:uncharacterized membrane protein YfcA